MIGKAGRRPLFVAVAIAFAVLPFAFGLIRALTTGQDVRYLWIALAALVGAAAVIVPARSREGSTGSRIAVVGMVFAVASLFAVIAAMILGTRFGPALLIVAMSFGFCFAVASLLRIQVTS